MAQGGGVGYPRAARFRAHDRRSVRLGVTVVSHDAGWRESARVHNVGLGGACLEIGQPLGMGERLTVSFLAPTLWDPLEIRARVAWSRATGSSGGATRAGVAFEHGREPDVLALFELIATLSF